MPIYEFECKKCKARSEVLQKLNDKLPVKCRKCGGRLEKLVSASAIKFKGTGWYVTDYAGNGKKGKSSEEKTESASSSSDKSESKSGSKEASPAKPTSETTSSTTKAPSGD